MSQATAPKISILGDGISTFEGYTPRLGSFYSPSYVSYSGFDSAEGTDHLHPPGIFHCMYTCGGAQIRGVMGSAPGRVSLKGTD